MSAQDRLLDIRARLTMTGRAMAQEAGRFDALRGVEVKAVTAFNLFQTPQAIAADMAHRADIKPHHAVLEPSAGLGRILAEIYRYSGKVAACEQSHELCAELYKRFPNLAQLVKDDFLERAPSLGLFDRVVMNPPFKMGRDIKHIKAAYELLKPQGRLVALCYNGARQNKQLMPWCDHWEVLPPNSFEGTSASVALLIKDNCHV